MTTTGSKLWFAIAGFCAVAAVVYFAGGSSENFGTLTLITVGSAALMLGVVSVVLRDADSAVGASVAAGSTTATSTATVTEQLPSAWPALAAFAGGVTAVGLATGSALLYAGIGFAAAVMVEWMVQGWAERVSAEPAYNRELRNRLMVPVEIPVTAALVIALVVLSFSRVLLALPKNGSTIIAIVLAATILLGATLIASRPRISGSVIAGACVVAAVALLAGGIVAGVHGERNFEEHKATNGVGGQNGAAGEHGSTSSTVRTDQLNGKQNGGGSLNGGGGGNGGQSTSGGTP